MRIQVNVSDEMVTKIDAYAKMLGVSRSALCSMWIGQSAIAYDKGMELTEKYANEFMVKDLLKKVKL